MLLVRQAGEEKMKFFEIIEAKKQDQKKNECVFSNMKP
jgi:hypothetical protein